MNTPTPTINAQIPGPLHVAVGGRTALFDANQNEVAFCATYGAGFGPMGCQFPWHFAAENARLLAAGYNAFDRAGRELGIDAAALAGKIDLARLIRAARDLAANARKQPARAAYSVKEDEINALCDALLPIAAALHEDAEKREVTTWANAQG